jgi:hypothetical protein
MVQRPKASQTPPPLVVAIREEVMMQRVTVSREDRLIEIGRRRGKITEAIRDRDLMRSDRVLFWGRARAAHATLEDAKTETDAARIKAAIWKRRRKANRGIPVQQPA